MRNLQSFLNESIETSSNSDSAEPFSTMLSKLEKISTWCNDYNFDDQGRGEQAAKYIINEARQLNLNQRDYDLKQDCVRFCDDCETLVKHFNILKKDQNIEGAQNVGEHLLENINLLAKHINYSLIQKVVEDFSDTNSPINKLSNFVRNPEGIFKKYLRVKELFL